MLSKMSAKNSVLIYDRKTRCREVACRPGMLVQVWQLAPPGHKHGEAFLPAVYAVMGQNRKPDRFRVCVRVDRPNFPNPSLPIK